MHGLLCAPSVGPGFDAGSRRAIHRVQARANGGRRTTACGAAHSSRRRHRHDHELQRVAGGDADRAGAAVAARQAVATRAPGARRGRAAQRAYLDRHGCAGRPVPREDGPLTTLKRAPASRARSRAGGGRSPSPGVVGTEVARRCASATSRSRSRSSGSASGIASRMSSSARSGVARFERRNDVGQLAAARSSSTSRVTRGGARSSSRNDVHRDGRARARRTPRRPGRP